MAVPNYDNVRYSTIAPNYPKQQIAVAVQPVQKQVVQVQQVQQPIPIKEIVEVE